VATDALSYDQANNVENVYIDRRFLQLLRHCARHRVNVNAITAQTTGTAQDYALVISSGSPPPAP